MKTEALDHFLGRNGQVKKNCAQAVLTVFQEALDISDQKIESYGSHGSGRAPGNECGAVFAAKAILMEAGDHKGAEEVDAFFHAEAGSIKCREIRHAKRMSCVACVQNAVGLVGGCVISTDSEKAI